MENDNEVLTVDLVADAQRAILVIPCLIREYLAEVELLEVELAAAKTILE